MRGIEYEVDEATGCWVWLKGLSPTGYPNGYAHRRYWEAVNGPRPAGFHIHHTCRNRACVNPDHLAAIHPNEHWTQHVLEHNPHLTLDDMRRIRELGRDPTVTQQQVADETGLHRNAIQRLWAGETWQHLFEGQPVLPDRTCPECGEVVEGRRNKVYCTLRCKINASNKRNQEHRNEYQRAYREAKRSGRS